MKIELRDILFLIKWFIFTMLSFIVFILFLNQQGGI